MINELIQCDCMDYMRTCKDKQFDLAIVDPEYGLDIANMNMGLGKSSRCSKTENRNWTKKNWDKTTPNKKYFDELFRISKNQIIFGGNYFNLPPTRGFFVWDKGEGMYGRSFSECEFGWTSFYYPARIIKICPVDKSRIHPTQKPVALYKWLLSHYAHPGDKLLDTHSGSGSFRIAAYDMGFDLISCEKDHDYCRDNEARYQAHIAQNELIPVQEIQQLTFGDK